MKPVAICTALVIILAFALPVGAADNLLPAWILRPVEPKSCLISVETGDLLEFSASDLERRMGLATGSLEGVTVVSLPPSAHGGLFLDGVEVEAYDYLDRDSLDRLCFAASESIGTAAVGLLPQAEDGAQVSLNIQVLDWKGEAPELYGESIETGRNIPAFGTLTASDPDSEPLHLALIVPPEKGELSLTGLSYRYDPYHNQTGSDYFIVCAVDSHGNYSAETAVNITINKQKRDFYYTDMVVHPSQYAALMLHDAGVHTGARVGSSYFFEPDDQISRGEFLMWLITAAGLADTMTPTVNTGLPNDNEIPSHLKRYVKQALEHKLLSPELAFRWNEIPSRAEAVVLIDRAAGIDDVKSYTLRLPDLEGIPHWARESYRDLAAYQMLELHDGAASPAKALDNAYAADLIWQLYKHIHR